jgi:flagellar basal-body rod protein FlgG
MRSLSIAATGMLSQQTNVDVISNNIANLSTTSYKKQRAEFQDLLYQHELRVGTQSSTAGNIIPTGIQVGLGVKTAAIYRNVEQGALVGTGNDLDLALDGRGYFEVTMADGSSAYTRAGSFQVAADGQIVTSDGFVVGPSITIPTNATDITINEEGEVLATLDSQTAPSNLGQLSLVTFVNAAGLQAEGGNRFTETDASGTPVTGFAGDDGFGNIKQKFLEQSNVDSVSEITTLITAQRAYELNSRVISTSDEMLQSISQLR